MVNKKIRSILRKAFVTAVTTALVATTVAGTSVTSFAAVEEDAPEAVVLEETEEVTEPEVTETTEEPEVTEVPEVIEVPEVTEVPEVIEEPEVTEVPEVEPEAEAEGEAEGEAEDEDEAEPVDDEEPEAAEDEDPEALLGLKKAGVLAENSEAESEEAFTLSKSDLKFYVISESDYNPQYIDISIKNTSNKKLTYQVFDVPSYLLFNWDTSVAAPGEEINVRITFNISELNFSGHTYPFSESLTISALDEENEIADSQTIGVTVFKTSAFLYSNSFGYDILHSFGEGREITTQYHGGIGVMETFLYWEKQVGNGEWVKVEEGVFTPGTWRCVAKVQIKEANVNNYALAPTYYIVVEGERWKPIEPSDGRTAYCYSSNCILLEPEEPEEAFTLSQSEIKLYVRSETNYQPGYIDIRIKNTGNKKLTYQVLDAPSYLRFSWGASEAAPGEEISVRILFNIAELNFSGHTYPFSESLTIGALDEENNIVENKKVGITVYNPNGFLSVSSFNYDILQSFGEGREITTQYHGGAGEIETFLYWEKQTDNGEWVKVEEGVFTPGTWRCVAKVQVKEEYVDKVGLYPTYYIVVNNEKWNYIERSDGRTAYCYSRNFTLLDPAKPEAFTLSQTELNFSLHTSPDYPVPTKYDIYIKNTSNENLSYQILNAPTYLNFQWDPSSVAAPGEEIKLVITFNKDRFHYSGDYPFSYNLTINALDEENEVVESKKIGGTISRPISYLGAYSITASISKSFGEGKAIWTYHSDGDELAKTMYWEKQVGFDEWVEIDEGVFTPGNWRCIAIVQVKDKYTDYLALKPDFALHVDNVIWDHLRPCDGKTAYCYRIFTIGEPVIETTGDSLKYELHSLKDIVVRCTCPLDDFEALSIDGVTLEKDVDYTVESGSTVATINGNYLETLAVGAHTLKLNYTGYRSASAELMVEYGPVEIESTADELKYQLRSMNDVVVRCSGALQDFEALSIDAVTLERDVDYTVESGSTVATIKAAYLETLAEGTHTVTFNYVGNRSASAELMVEYAPVEIETTEALKYQLRSMKDVVVTCSGALQDFQALSIDDATLEKDVDYTVEAGSTVATIKAAYLETLAEGTHTVTFYYAGNRTASAELTVEKANNNPCENHNVCDEVITVATQVVIGTTIVTKTILSIISRIVGGFCGFHW
jgi:hypothetical protein